MRYAFKDIKTGARICFCADNSRLQRHVKSLENIWRYKNEKNQTNYSGSGVDFRAYSGRVFSLYRKANGGGICETNGNFIRLLMRA